MYQGKLPVVKHRSHIPMYCIHFIFVFSKAYIEKVKLNLWGGDLLLLLCWITCPRFLRPHNFASPLFLVICSLLPDEARQWQTRIKMVTHKLFSLLFHWTVPVLEGMHYPRCSPINMSGKVGVEQWNRLVLLLSLNLQCLVSEQLCRTLPNTHRTWGTRPHP